jgi:hypothetical protein
MTCVTRVEEAVEGAMSCADAVSSAQARRPPHRLCVYPWRSAGTAAPGMRERHTYVGKGAVKLSGWQARRSGGRARPHRPGARPDDSWRIAKAARKVAMCERNDHGRGVGVGGAEASGPLRTPLMVGNLLPRRMLIGSKKRAAMSAMPR